MRQRGSSCGCNGGLARDAGLDPASVHSLGAQDVCDMDSQIGGKPDLGIWPRHLRPTAMMDQSASRSEANALEHWLGLYTLLHCALKQRSVDAVPAVVRRPVALDQGQGLDEVASSSKDLCLACLVVAAS